MEPILILGGGPAGLSAAWTLAEAGREVVVVEQQDQPGGLCRTVERDGFRFDLGGHRLISKDEQLIRRIRDLMGDTLLERGRRSHILIGGQKLAYPLELRDLVQKMPRRFLARAAADYALQATSRRVRPRPVRSFEDWTVARFGRPLYDAFFGPYTQKLWGIHPRHLSADWAAQRISLMNLTDVTLRLAGLRTGGARTYARRYLYPQQGIGQLFERLVEHLRGRGVRFAGGTRAVGLTLQDRHVTGVHVESNGEQRTLACEQVVSSIPLPGLVRMVDPTLRRPAEGLRCRGLRFLNIALTGPPLLDATWCYVSEPHYTMTRIQEPIQRSPQMAPAGHTSVMLEVPCDPGDPLWEASDDALMDRLAPQMARLGLPIRDRALWWFSVRAPDAYPVYGLDYRARRQRLLDRVDEVKNLHTIGRQGLFRYVFMDTAMEMGHQAASDLLAGREASTTRLMALDQQNTLLEIQATTA